MSDYLVTSFASQGVQLTVSSVIQIRILTWENWTSGILSAVLTQDTAVLSSLEENLQNKPSGISAQLYTSGSILYTWRPVV